MLKGNLNFTYCHLFTHQSSVRIPVHSLFLMMLRDEQQYLSSRMWCNSKKLMDSFFYIPIYSNEVWHSTIEKNKNDNLRIKPMENYQIMPEILWKTSRVFGSFGIACLVFTEPWRWQRIWRCSTKKIDQDPETCILEFRSSWHEHAFLTLTFKTFSLAEKHCESENWGRIFAIFIQMTFVPQKWQTTRKIFCCRKKMFLSFFSFRVCYLWCLF